MGVLAGFVVAAIAVVLERPKFEIGDGRNRSHDGIPSLFCALIAFVVAAFLYGIAGGVESSPHRAAAMILASALPAAAAVSSLACGLLGLLLDSAHWELTNRGATYFTLAAAAGLSAYVFVSGIDALKVGASDQSPAIVAWLLVAALGACMIVVLVLVIGASTPRLRRSWRALNTLNNRLTRQRGSDEAILGFASLVIVLIGVGYFLVLFYAPRLASYTWPTPILLAVWIGYVVIFIDTSSGMQRPGAMRTAREHGAKEGDSAGAESS